jgi:hypothetical protein
MANPLLLVLAPFSSLLAIEQTAQDPTGAVIKKLS